MAKLGDSKNCRLCGGRAVLVKIRPRNAAFTGSGAAIPAPTPEHLAWKCEECEDEEPFNGELTRE
jgi:hypothetical protein